MAFGHFLATLKCSGHAVQKQFSILRNGYIDGIDCKRVLDFNQVPEPHCLRFKSRRMSERSQSPISDCNSRPDDFSRPMYAQALSQEAFGGTSLQIPHGVLQHHSLLFNKTAYNGLPPTPQTFFQFPPVGGDYRASDLQAGDFCQPKHWCPIAAPEYTGQVAGVAAPTHLTNLRPPNTETREQVKMSEIKLEKDANDEYGQKIQHYPTPPSSAVAHGVYYSTPWNSSFWPGFPHITAANTNTQNLNSIPSTSSSSSPSLSPSPPSNGLPGVTFFNGSASQTAQAPQAQTSTRSSGSSSGGCSDSEEEVSQNGPMYCYPIVIVLLCVYPASCVFFQRERYCEMFPNVVSNFASNRRTFRLRSWNSLPRS